MGRQIGKTFRRMISKPLLSTNDNELKLFYTNCNELTNKIDHFITVLSAEKFDIGCICETKVNSNIYDAEISFDGFQIFRSDRRSGKIGGGFCVYVKNSMIANNLSDFVFDDCLALKIVNYNSVTSNFYF